jgi:hypothetical protein
MAKRYQSARATRKLAKKSRRNFFISLALIVFLFYAAFTWILPSLINGARLVKGLHPTPKPSVDNSPQNSSLAPPILSIPYEATNTAQIDIKGYATPHSKVSLYLDDAKIDTVDVSGDGSFGFSNLSLNLGINNIYGKSIDEQNQQSLPSKTFRITYANEKPALDINTPEDNKKIQGGDKKVTISGKTTPGDEVFINGSQVIVDKDGNFNSQQDINEGDNNFDIKAVDNATNTTDVQRKVTYSP